MSHARPFVALVMLVLAQVAPSAEPGRVGQAVLPKRANTRILHTDAKGAVVPVTLTRTHYYVREERDGCVRIRQQGVDGWLDLRDVLSPEQAVAFFTEQLRADPTNTRAYLMRGTAWDVREDTDKALADYNEAARLDPTNPKVLCKRGSVWIDKMEFDRAFKDFAEALRLDPKCANAYYSRGYARYKRKDYDAALEDFDTVLRLDPTDAEAAAFRGGIWAERGDLERAMTEVNSAITLDVECATAVDARAVLWAKQGEQLRALRDFDVALRLDPTNAVSHAGRGALWGLRGDFDRALADLNEAVRLDPHEASAFVNRGAIEFALGNFDQAWHDFTEAVRLDPADATALQNKAGFLAVCPDAHYRDGKAALELAVKACASTDYREAGKISCLAAAHAEAGQFAEAIRWQTRALELAKPTQKADYLAVLDTFQAGKPYREIPGRSRTMLGLCSVNVWVKAERTRLVRAPDQPTAYVATLNRPAYVILEQQGDWLKVREKGVEGWLKRADVLLTDEADDYFTACLRQNPKDARAYRLRAAVAEEQGLAEQPGKDVEEAIRLAPDHPQSYWARGYLRLRQDDLDGALADAAESIRLDPSDADGWEVRGCAAILHGDIDKGLADLSEAIRLDPTQENALVKKAIVLATHPEAKYRDGKAAVDLARRACALADYLEVGSLRALAAALAEAGDFAEAVKWQSRACLLATGADKDACDQLLALFKAGKPYHEGLLGRPQPPFTPWCPTPVAATTADRSHQE